jgi:ATP-dependent DNA helicase RecG
MGINEAISELRGVGPTVVQLFAKLGIKTASELIDYYPRKYEDYSVITPIARIRPGIVTVKAVIKQAKGRYVRRGMHITEAVASDETGSVRIVWFNQPYRETGLKQNQEYYISGNYELKYQRLTIMNPSVELVSDFPINTARIVPIYRVTKGLNSRQIRKCLQQLLPVIRSLPETLPAWIMQEQHLLSRAKAVEMMHFPENSEILTQAKRRLGFEEVFELSLASLLNKLELLDEQAPSVAFESDVAKGFVAHLPFKLTDAQRKVVWHIYRDMEKTQPMNRLIEGDVGAGKTVVAAMTAVMVMHSGHQVAFMAPTELLARQHAETLQRLFKPLGLAGSVGLLVGSMSAAQKNRAHKAIREGKIRLIVGTHALIQEKVDMHSLELVIIDEQHRFGVEQRKALQAKAGHMPHVLSLTATPIPRSLALTLYGDLDISLLDEKPGGRKSVITEIASPNSRSQLYKRIDKELASGRQMFVVCPLITEANGAQLQSAERVYAQLSTIDLKQRRVGILHGKMKAGEKNAVMQKFVAHELDVLVATTVVEVGVDVPNATIMLIEAADHFGLAQLHQLRGRIGRSEHQGYCFLMMSESAAPPKRLRALVSSSDGFRLAELDLELRGPGAIYGQMQHGQLDLRVAKLTDVALVASARNCAREFIDRNEDLLQYKQLHDKVKQLRAVTNLN